MSHEEIKSLLGAYALGAVDEAEARQVQAHLPTCPECSAEFKAMSEAASAFAVAAAPEGFEPGFADRIVGTISHEAAPGADVVEITPRRRMAVRAALASGIAALLAAVVVLSLATVHANDQLDQQKAALQSLVNSGNGFHLTGSSGARAEAVSSIGGNGRFIVIGLDSAPAGKTYQVWIKRGKKTYSAGTFNTSNNIAVASMTGTLRRGDRVLVTVEPAGGSKHPTTTPILSS
jgi:anti-sigma-K factor RskA